uniref:RNA helicase n=1 Tax=Syphacia muris TaxID=451379 RepID=A0A0N5A8P4_9BILA
MFEVECNVVYAAEGLFVVPTSCQVIGSLYSFLGVSDLQDHDVSYDTGTGEEFSGPDTQATMDFQKNFYAESPAVSSRCQDEIDKWIADNKVTLNGDSLPRPVFELVEVGFPKIITDFLSKSFSKPTVIQSVSWPIALSGIDIVSVAMTGSGKTLAFLLPGIVHASMQSTREDPKSPAVVILLPTRELVQQVGDVCSHYCKLMGLRFACVFGGSSKIPQMNSLRRGIDILIATPGRLLDFLQDHVVKLKCCSFLVLDEADRMLDMGFEPQIRKIICRTRDARVTPHIPVHDVCSLRTVIVVINHVVNMILILTSYTLILTLLKDRQTLMFSATWPEGVRNLASEFQTNPAFSNVGSLGLAANHNITQVVKVIEEYKKQSTLMDLLNELVKESEKKVLVFVGTKRRADQLVTAVRRNGLTSLSIHGDKSQSERDRVLRVFLFFSSSIYSCGGVLCFIRFHAAINNVTEFRSGRTPILLATNVAARGLGQFITSIVQRRFIADVNDIGCVINYDCPQNIADYVHRIGRTGRCENKGLAYTLFTPEDDLNAKDLIDVMKEADQKVPFELLRMSRIQKSERYT